jgi:hypothetical protein
MRRVSLLKDGHRERNSTHRPREHRMIMLELAQRFPPGADLDAAWQQGSPPSRPTQQPTLASRRQPPGHADTRLHGQNPARHTRPKRYRGMDPATAPVIPPPMTIRVCQRVVTMLSEILLATVTAATGRSTAWPKRPRREGRPLSPLLKAQGSW